MLPILNWNRKRSGWTDIQNAKIISLINGDGVIIKIVNNPLRFICCTKAELNLYLNRFRNKSYEYPLQMWDGTSYVLYELGVSGPYPQQFIHFIEEFVMRGKPVSNGLEVSVVTVYLTKHFASSKITKSLESVLLASGIWDLLYDTALNFITTNRPNEIYLFKKIYSSKMPRDCFVNLYDVDVNCGINTHRDHVSFCTVVFCVVGNKEGNLILTLDTGEKKVISMKSNDIVVFARIQHSVEISTRSEKRITINAFF